MIEELLEFISKNFTVEPDTGRVTKPDGKLLTATKFQGLPLTAKEVVWAYSQRQLPVGIMLLDPDRQVHKFALDNLEQYDESEEQRKVYRNPTGQRLAWEYREGVPPVLVELSEYRTVTSIIKLSPMNWRYSEIGLSEEEARRFQLTRNALRLTNLAENAYWKVMTENLRLIRGKSISSLGSWINHARHSQTYSHKDRPATIHEFTELKVRRPRANKKLGRYAQERIAESQQQTETSAKDTIERQQRMLRRTSKDSPLLKYAEEVLFPSLQREAFDLEMAKWITENTIL